MGMKIGLCFPYTQEGLTREITLEWFKRVDEGPFSTISCGERMIGSRGRVAPRNLTSRRSQNRA